MKTDKDALRILGLEPGAGREDVERAFRERKSLYAQGNLATYALMDEEERGHQLERIEAAYRKLIAELTADERVRSGRGGRSGKGRKGDAGRPDAAARGAEAARGTETARGTEAEPGADATAEPSSTAGSAEAPSESPAEAAQAAEPGADAEAKDSEPKAAEPPPAPPLEPDERPGAWLRRRREALGLSLKDIAAQTRILSAHLENLEDERYEALPATVYVRGFVVSYARAVGAGSADGIAAAYLERFKAWSQSRGKR